jgi:broad specificity phosphatase PhoE
VLILLVRHGHAGSKAAWDGDDDVRPLNERGLAEAKALVDVVERFAPTRIVSSPLLRCVQTVEPLAGRLAIPVEVSERLVPGARKRVRAFLREIATDTTSPVAVCTHGEVIQVVQTAFPKRVSGAKTRTVRAKGSTWVLEYSGGRLRSARYLPAPRWSAGQAAT